MSEAAHRRICSLRHHNGNPASRSDSAITVSTCNGDESYRACRMDGWAENPSAGRSPSCCLSGAPEERVGKWLGPLCVERFQLFNREITAFQMLTNRAVYVASSRDAAVDRL